MSPSPLHRAAVLLGTLFLATPAWAQIQQQPVTALASDACQRDPAAPGFLTPPPMLLPPPPDPLAPPPIAPADAAPLVGAESEPDPDAPRDSRQGLFQKVSLDATWLAPGNSSGLGMTDLEARCTLGLPAPTREWPMLVSPGFAMHWLDVPPGVDLPNRVYDANIQFRWLPRINERVLLNLAVTPGVYRDFDSETTGGVRTTVDLAGVWISSPRSKFVLGVSYRDRLESNWIPIAGWLWRPTPEWRFDLLFPEPKVRRRVYWLSPPGSDTEDWLYVAGEWADSVWAFTRSDGSADRFAYKDLRLLFGLQRDALGGVDWRIEAGYVFSRQIRTQSGLGEFNPSGTAMLRAGVQY